MIAILGAVGIVFVVVSIALVLAARRVEPEARTWIVNAIETHYKAHVELGEFHASLYPVPKASIEDVVLTLEGRPELPPLAKIKRMTVEASFFGIRQKPLRISNLTLEGLEISIPPRQHKDRPAGSSLVSAPSESHAGFVLENIIADGMVLRLIPSDPGHDPREFEFANLHLSSVGIDRPMAFKASRANWKPPGQVETTGEFGPWDAEQPGETPLDGKYTFRDADLSVFKGISGKLASDGEYHGRLNRIECSGTTETPNFAVSVGKPVDLKTEFRAIVDGTNGDTTLEFVNARFLKTAIAAHGAVLGARSHKGKDIALTVSVDQGRIEDILHLTMKSNVPFMTGPLTFRAAFNLPTGSQTIVDRLNLQGHFNLSSGHFTNLRVQDILGNISRRAEGEPKAEVDENVASNFSGDFTLQSAIMSFSRLVFDIPGAEIRLSGSYGIHGAEIDFTGQARTEA